MGSMTVSGASDFQRRAAELVAERQAGVAAAPSKSSKPSKRKARRSAKRIGDKSKYQLKFSHLKAFAAGAVAIALARLVRYYLAGAPMLDQGSELLWVTDITLAGLVAYISRKLIFWKIEKVMLWHMLGAFAMLISMHNLVHRFPAEFAMAFSPQYVETVLVNTTPNSLVFRGMVIDKNGMNLMAGGAETGVETCGVGAITGLVGGDLVGSMGAVQDACF